MSWVPWSLEGRKPTRNSEVKRNSGYSYFHRQNYGQNYEDDYRKYYKERQRGNNYDEGLFQKHKLLNKHSRDEMCRYGDHDYFSRSDEPYTKETTDVPLNRARQVMDGRRRYPKFWLPEMQVPSTSTNLSPFFQRAANMLPATVTSDVCLANNNANGEAQEPDEKDKIITSKAVKEMMKEVNPNVVLEQDVVELLVEVMDEYVERMVSTATTLARHRGSTVVEVKDVVMTCDQNVDSLVGASSYRPIFREVPEETENHMKRMALKRKAIRRSRSVQFSDYVHP